MDDAKYKFLILPIYTLWKLGPLIHNDHTPPSIHNWTGKKIGQSGKRRSGQYWSCFDSCVSGQVSTGTAQILTDNNRLLGFITMVLRKNKDMILVYKPRF